MEESALTSRMFGTGLDVALSFMFGGVLKFNSLLATLVIDLSFSLLAEALLEACLSVGRPLRKSRRNQTAKGPYSMLLSAEGVSLN